MTAPPLRGLLSDQGVLDRTIRELTARFDGVFAEETIRRYVIESYDALARNAAVTSHLAVLTGRFANERLTALGQHTGLLTSTVPEILFVCVQNAGRSQIAAAIAQHFGAGRVHVRSAGSTPVGDLDPVVHQVLAEITISVPEAYSKPLTDDVVRAADVVVTMGCGDACPVYPGTKYQDWYVPDPAGLPIENVRDIRDELVRHVKRLLGDLDRV